MHNLFCDISICIKNYHPLPDIVYLNPQESEIDGQNLYILKKSPSTYIFSFWSFLAFLLAIKKNWLYNLMRIEEDARTRTTNVPSYAMYNLHSTTLFNNYFFCFILDLRKYTKFDVLNNADRIFFHFFGYLPQ